MGEPDLTLEVRVLRAFVLGAKRVLTTEWGYPMGSVYADAETGEVYVERDQQNIAMTVSVSDAKLKIEYGKDWKEYFETLDWPQIQKPADLANSKLAKVPTNGLGKGKKG